MSIESKISSDDSQNIIEQMRSSLDQYYLNAEKIMSLRNPKSTEIDTLLPKIDQTYDKLVEAMAAANLGSEAIVADTQNQHEFHTRKNERYAKLNQTPSENTSNVPTPSSTDTTRSEISSSFSYKSSSRTFRTTSTKSSMRMQSETKLRLAQIESEHQKERLAEKEWPLCLAAEKIEL